MKVTEQCFAVVLCIVESVNQILFRDDANESNWVMLSFYSW